MFKTCLILYVFSFLASGGLCEKENPIVDTTNGKIEGKLLTTLLEKHEYYGFMGIPYAVPPLKELRFKPPKPIEPWDDILKTNKEKPACAQFNNNIRKEQSFGFYGSEDCLYLDIFTPALDKNNRAVIVFLYNENFVNSYNKTRDYAHDFFIEEDVVVVTISHRLAVFGFLSLEDENYPGNSGLKDVVLALEWVRDNIEIFGGDKDRITLMGSQGGAAFADLLMHSKAKPLFSAIILQSGTSSSTAPLQENLRERAFNLGEILNVSTPSQTQLIKELIEIPPKDLVSRDLHASPKDYFKETQRSVVAFGPIVEKLPDGLITEYPENSLSKIDIPIMLGFNSREGLFGSMQYLIQPVFISYLKKDFPLLLPIRLKFAFHPAKDAFQDAIEELKQYYFNGEISIKKSVPDFITYIGDAIIAYAMDYTARKYANSSSNLYYYHFDYYSSLNENKINILKQSEVQEGTWGAASGDELCYLFRCPSLKEEYLKHDKEMSEERIIQKKMVRIWTNFAKYRNPTPEKDDLLDDLKWPSYTLEKKDYLHIDKQLEIKQDLYKDKFKFWDDFISKWEKEAVDGIIHEPIRKRDEL
ncbi:hypothetical protein K1T71_010388 [Dendrolimus kikuchii]|uniref:Uncharacterized protein n=1 Tax=Dendrolimus kikuchii TaxID=765133 RepID=A0ACC1CRL5_9NEOP|nr:hypothetical protein K1T71_010388 [Dendrolimus kikuchii]